MKKLFLSLIMLLGVLLLSAPLSAQDFPAIMEKMKALQYKMMTGLKYQQEHDYKAAIREYEEALLIEVDLKKNVKGMPEIEKGVNQMILQITLSIASCARFDGDLEQAREYYKTAYQLAIAQNSMQSMITIVYEYALLCRDINDYNNFTTYFNALKEIKKKFDEVDSAKLSDSEQVIYYDVYNRYRSLYLTDLEFLYSLNKLDEVIKRLDDGQYRQIEKKLSAFTPELLAATCKKLSGNNAGTILPLITLMYEVIIGNVTSKMLAINYHGMCERSRGNYAEALKAFEESLAFIRSLDIEKEKSTIDHIKEAAIKNAESLEPSTKSQTLSIFNTFKGKDLEEMLLIFLINNKYHRARTYQKIGNLTKATELLREIEKDCTRISPCYRQQILPSIYYGEGELVLATGSPQKAREYATKALTLCGDSPFLIEYRWKSENLLGKIYEHEGLLNESQRAYEQAVADIEELMLSLYIDKQQEEFFQERTEPYEGIIRVLIKQGKPQEAFSYAEKMKAASLRLHLGELIVKQKLTGEKQETLQSLALQNAMAQKDMKRNADSPSPSKAQEGALKNKSIAIKKQLNETLQSDEPDFRNLVLSSAISCQDALKVLNEDTAILEYLYQTSAPKGENKVYLFLVTSREQKVLTLDIAPEELIKAVTALCKTYSEKGSNWEVPASSLFSSLVAPVLPLIKGKKHLIIIPHQELNKLPFHALLDSEDRPLIEKFSITYAPSVTTLKLCREKKTAPGQKLAAFAYGNIQKEGISPLPETNREVDSLKQIYKDADVFKEKDFSLSNVLKVLKEKNVLHFATHGMLNDNTPENSCLVTSSGINISVDKILGFQDQKMQANLVVMSACQTGKGKLYPGDGQVGLTRSFMYAGTPSVVASLWSVSDESTADLMEAFYRNLASGLDKGEALRKAELEIMGKYPHPFHWAPFILVGDWT
ncbi:MAG: CHAT domain-containing protein [Candidatus Eremiobacteraeota bacterium]|nr:CHAT domain-containing protein [Candidatus Eremiobacteraeota bacterium]